MHQVRVKLTYVRSMFPFMLGTGKGTNWNAALVSERPQTTDAHPLDADETETAAGAAAPSCLAGHGEPMPFLWQHLPAGCRDLGVHIFGRRVLP